MNEFIQLLKAQGAKKIVLFFEDASHMITAIDELQPEDMDFISFKVIEG